MRAFLKRRSRIEWVALAILAGLLVACAYVYVIFYTPASRDGGVRVVEIARGASFRVVVASLEKAGVIRNSGSFTLLAKLRREVKSVKAGEYELNRSMTPVEVLDALVNGRVKKYQVTIPEGYNLYEIAALLDETGITDGQEIIARATDAGFTQSFGVEGRSLEGYLFPDTYILEKGMSADDIIGKMVGRFKSVYYSEFDGPVRGAGMSMAKVVTLASIIEKETGSADERPMISAVFHNRLKKRIKLQSDPTVIYAIKDFDGNLKRIDLLRKNPYNTYIIYGLPPGPIANPGQDSLRAALFPAQGDYLYFVSKNNGTHYFSKSLREHNNAVNAYQRQRRMKAVKEG